MSTISARAPKNGLPFLTSNYTILHIILYILYHENPNKIENVGYRISF